MTFRPPSLGKIGKRQFWTGSPVWTRFELLPANALFEQLEARIADEIPRRVAGAEAGGADPSERDATWTYLTTDQPFGSWNERIMRGIVRKVRSRSVWG